MTLTNKLAAIFVVAACFCAISSDASAMPISPICQYYPTTGSRLQRQRFQKGNFVPCLRSAPMLVCGGYSVILSYGATCEPDSSAEGLGYLLCGESPPSRVPGGGSRISAPGHVRQAGAVATLSP